MARGRGDRRDRGWPPDSIAAPRTAERGERPGVMLLLDSTARRTYLSRVMRTLAAPASYYYYSPRITGRVRSRMR